MCQYCWLNTFGIRTWQIWECIWNWDSPRPVPTGGHHKSATSSLAMPCTPAGLPTVPLRQDVLGPRYFSDQILPCSLTPLTRFGLLNCPAVWLSTLGLRDHLWFPSGCNVIIADSVEPELYDGCDWQGNNYMDKGNFDMTTFCRNNFTYLFMLVRVFVAQAFL